MSDLSHMWLQGVISSYLVSFCVGMDPGEVYTGEPPQCSQHSLPSSESLLPQERVPGPSPHELQLPIQEALQQDGEVLTSFLTAPSTSCPKLLERILSWGFWDSLGKLAGMPWERTTLPFTSLVPHSSLFWCDRPTSHLG